jgi:hypothetical protein
VSRFDEGARLQYEQATGKSARTKRSIHCAPSDGVARYPFTIRLPVMMYARLRDKAEKEKRSVAAQVELDLQGLYS